MAKLIFIINLLFFSVAYADDSNVITASPSATTTTSNNLSTQMSQATQQALNSLQTSTYDSFSANTDDFNDTTTFPAAENKP